LLASRNKSFLIGLPKRVVLWAVLLAATLLGTYVLEKNTRNENLDSLSFLSGDPDRGARLFSQLGCNACHSIFGIGQTAGPDLAKASSGDWNPVRIVSELWNHGPQMWEKMKNAQLGIYRVSGRDMLDLLSYLYLIRYVDVPGDPARGKDLFSSKQCNACHALSGNSQGEGPNLARLDVATPILWAQRMWNHSQGMEARMSQKHIAWPVFENGEMLNLLAYLQENTSGKHLEANLFPAVPAKGKLLFAQKGCIQCHAINGDGGNIGPDLGSQHKAPPSLTQFAGLLWNHSPQMRSRMGKNTVPQPQFSEQEMADLIAYLYAVKYLDSVGRVDSGMQVFHEKHCSNCHGADGRGGKWGPNLAHWQAYSVVQMGYMVWTHGPEMYRKRRDRNISWPSVDEPELVDLIAFLNSL